MFGNITGGGELSSKYDYNPTPYIEVKLSSFENDFAYGVSIFGAYLEGYNSNRCFA